MVAQKLNDLGVGPADFDDVVFVWRNVVDNGYFVVAACLAGIFNAWLLWRYLRRDGLLRPQPGWGRHLLRIAVACVAMTAVVLGISYRVGDWTAMDLWHRTLWLLAAVAAGAAAYGIAVSLLMVMTMKIPPCTPAGE